MANPLKSKDPQISTKRTAQEWCDRGNAILAGQIPMEHGKNAGQFMYREDVRWIVRNGRPSLEPAA